MQRLFGTTLLAAGMALALASAPASALEVKLEEVA